MSSGSASKSGSCCLCRCGGAVRRWLGGGPAAFALGSAAEELQTFADHLQLRPFLAGLLVVPGIETESAFDEDGSPFPEILLRDFGHSTPERHINKSNLFFLFVVVVFP